jgi:PAS domain S-box-containing protein
LAIDTELLKVLPVAVYMTDTAGFITFYNDAAAEFWGTRPELGRARWTGAHRLYSVTGEPIALEDGPVASTLRSGEAERHEYITERSDGTRVHTLSFPYPLRNGRGKPIGCINLLTDVTDSYLGAAAQARLAAIVASSDDAIATKTLTGHITSWNKGATRIFGYEESEILGHPVNIIVPPELQDEEKQILARIARGEHIDHYETVRVAKDGRRVDISLTVSPLHDKHGRIVGASKVARDITEKKRAEEMQRLLLGELNHRVKNMLAIVQSIAAQTLRSAASPEAFARSFTGRVQALARAHTLFTRDSWQGTDIHDLVRDQLLLDDEKLDGEEDKRIEWSGPRVMLAPQLAMSLSLILHELGTNARKYGALSVPGGRLSLQWSLDAKACLVLHWVERGGPLVQVPLRRGFGTTLIEKGLKTHGGEAEIHYDPEGLSCEIKLPVPPDKQISLPLDGPPAAAARRADAPSLQGKRILVIEDEPLVSMDIESCLAEAGSTVVGPANSVTRARQLIESERFDGALVDANLAGQPVDELARALAARDIPFVFLTGYGRDSLPAAFRDAGIIGKPYTHEQLVAATGQMLNGRQVASS